MSRKKKERPPFKVCRDTRERLPWDFPADPDTGCQGTVTTTLKTGDYTLEGLENQLVIERKRNTSELSQNLFQERFEKELERLEAFDLPLVICEFTGDDVEIFPANSGIPPARWKYLRVTPALIWKKLAYFQTRYKTRFLLAGKGAQSLALALFKQAAADQLERSKGAIQPPPDDVAPPPPSCAD